MPFSKQLTPSLKKVVVVSIYILDNKKFGRRTSEIQEEGQLS
jgi:hypothetical protein